MSTNKTPRSKAVAAVLNEQRATRILRMFIEGGMTQTAIAKKEGMCQAMVSETIKAKKEEWREQRALAIAEQQEEEMGKLTHLEAVAWEAYRLSCLPAHESQAEQEKRLEDLKQAAKEIDKAQTKINGKKQGHPGVPKMLQVPAKLRVVGERAKEILKERAEGNPQFLLIVKWCREVRLKMLGLLKDGDLNVDNRQGNFIDMPDIWQQLVRPPIPDDAPNETALRIKALREMQPDDDNIVEVEGKVEPREPEQANGKVEGTNGQAHY